MNLHIPAIIDRAFPDLALLREAADEAERRAVSMRTLEVIDYKEGKDDGDDDVLLPGTVTLVLARRGSEPFAAAFKSLRNKGRFDAATIRKVKAAYRQRRLLTMPEALVLLKEQPTIAELIGGRFTLAASLFVPRDLDLVLAPMPYNGGALDGVPFQFIERHAAEEPVEHYEAFLVRRPPRLTPAEIAALKLVPRDAFDLNVGRVAMCYAVTAVTIVAVVIFATTACPGKMINIHLDDDDIKKLGPERTSRMLIRLRRQALDRRL